jgi:WD40 repeat protein
VTDQYANLKIWDLTARRLVTELRKPHGGSIEALDFSPDSQKLVTLANGNLDKRVFLWSVPEWKVIAEWSCPVHSWVVKFAPDGSMVATGDSGGNRNLNVWSLKGQLQGSFELYPQLYSNVLSMAFSPDSRFIAAAGNDGTTVGPGLIAAWDLRQGREVFRLQTPGPTSSVCFAKKWLAWSAKEASIMEWPPAHQAAETPQR